MDLAQYPVRPRGSLDDPLADPFDDPSYSFSFRTPDQSRSEENDSGNRIRGLYSYLDDVGERHSVRYAAGAGTGFEISNAVPDNPSSVAYSSPLYKAPPRTRGKMSVQRGPAGSYKLIAAGPDHRRAESRAPDGLVRGTYSFLDDKGVQRTVEYIAGAGIGYRVVHNRIGPGTHINPSVADFRLADTDFRLANDFGRGAGGGLGVATGSASGGSGSGPSGAGVGGGGGGGRGRADRPRPGVGAAASRLTVIKNVGKWYVGLPPGQSVRAHVQNIDIVPLGGRVGLSPSEALRQDEIADLAASREH
ncbi:GL20693 [Drosophila persimilis]|uniref:GL20693 n=1 Tax=Drosophila persimilis TaxID=7234 RepID=B4H4E4_DROPE|nr:GL20693 [Drosophila persimilis]